MYALLLSFLCMLNVILLSISLDPNWSYFTGILEVNKTYSCDLVKEIPIHSYWDTGRSGYRIGVIPKYIENLLPELISKKDIRFNRKGKITVVANASVIEYQLLYGYMTACVQKVYVDLFCISSLISNIARDITAIKNGATETTALLSGLQMSWEIRVEHDLASHQLSVLKEQIQAERDLALVGRQLIANSTKELMAFLEEIHLQKISAREGYHSRRLEIQRNKQAALLELAAKARDIAVFTETHKLEADKQVAENTLRAEIARAVEIAKFRIAEQSRVDRDADEMREKIRIATGQELIYLMPYLLMLGAFSSPRYPTDLSVQSFEAVSEAVLKEISLNFISLFDSKSSALWNLIGLFVAVLVLTVTVELGQISVVYIGSLLSKNAVANVSMQRLHSNEGSSPNKALTLSKKCLHDLDSILNQLVQRQQADVRNVGGRGLLLPNVLILGPAGCGKSSAAEYLARGTLARLPGVYCVRVTGTELVGAGADCGARLRRVFDWANRIGRNSIRSGRNEFCLLLLDGLEDIVVPRRSTHGLYYGLKVLLHELRLNSPWLCVVITAELVAQQVDEAFLDRVDALVSCEFPTALLRRLYLLRLSSELLGSRSNESGSLLDPQQLDQLRIALLDLEAYMLKADSEPVVAAEITSAADGERVIQMSALRDDPTSLSFLDFIDQLVDICDGWTYRACYQVILSLQIKALGSESCTITSAILNGVIRDSQMKSIEITANLNNESRIAFVEEFNLDDSMEEIVFDLPER